MRVGAIYVLELVGWGVKVGRSERPAERIKVLSIAARRDGLIPGRRWISQTHAIVNLSERMLIHRCAAIATSQRSREYLHLDYDLAVPIAQDITKDIPVMNPKDWTPARQGELIARVGTELRAAMVTKGITEREMEFAAGLYRVTLRRHLNGGFDEPFGVARIARAAGTDEIAVYSAARRADAFLHGLAGAVA